MSLTHHIRSVAAAFIVINHIIRKKKRRRLVERQKPRWWMKHLYKNRLQYGNKLLDDLRFEYVDETVQNFTRMTWGDFEHLLLLISQKIRKTDTHMREAITTKERLLITLRFLATGDSYTSLQYLFRVSKQSISRIVPEVCDAIIDALKDYVKVPSPEEEWLPIAQEFEEKWNFPHAIGAIDGKHVMIQAPLNSGTEFFNYKSFFSIVLLALVDAHYNFLYADVGCQGRISDGGVFKNSILYKKLENQELNIPQPEILQIPYAVQIPYVILADKAFALSEYTMKPFEGTPEKGSIERIFNYRLSRGRRVVENAFGVLSSVFRVLRKPMLLQPDIAKKVVLATIHLHNFLRKRSDSRQLYTPPGTFDSEENGEIIAGRWRNEQQQMQPLVNVPRRASAHAKEIRSHFAQYFITNGPIPWQNNY